MINTKLVLLEGPPGSGKTTTALKLHEAISSAGIACQCFWEWDANHPIQIGDDLHLGEAIRTAITRAPEMLKQWHKFAQERESQNLVTILESRFWQTSAMLEYVAGRTIEGVMESNQRVIDIVKVLNPVLIYFAIDDPRGFTARTIQIKEEEWQRGNLPGTWSQHLFEAFDGQPWAVQRGLSGMPAMLTLMDEYATVTDRLFDQLPFPKLKIRNPHLDWDDSMRKMVEFLEIRD